VLVSHVCSIIAAAELDFCVRNENRYFLSAMGTEVRFKTLCADIKKISGSKPCFDVLETGCTVVWFVSYKTDVSDQSPK
jgi:hypothetical protein